MEDIVLLKAPDRAAYEKPNVIEHYGRVDQLLVGEIRIFTELDRELREAILLDLGIGGGRTTGHLKHLAKYYIGVDYVEGLVETARRNHPDADIRWGDARSLTGIDGDSIDIVLFSYNGISGLTPADRLLVLAEVRRVLRPGGKFIFSAHNRNYKWFRKLPWQRKFQFDAAFVKFFLYALYHLPNHFRMRRFETANDDFALVNDSDHAYMCVFYYISVDKQIQQLLTAGFEDITPFDVSGNKVQPDARCPESHWIYYIAQKPAV